MRKTEDMDIKRKIIFEDCLENKIPEASLKRGNELKGTKEPSFDDLIELEEIGMYICRIAAEMVYFDHDEAEGLFQQSEDFTKHAIKAMTKYEDEK